MCLECAQKIYQIKKNLWKCKNLGNNDLLYFYLFIGKNMETIYT
jgi:hypothetical protein